MQADFSPQEFDTLTFRYYRIPAVIMPVQGTAQGFSPGPGGYLR
jgi:hypothetical protein